MLSHLKREGKGSLINSDAGDAMGERFGRAWRSLLTAVLLYIVVCIGADNLTTDLPVQFVTDRINPWGYLWRRCSSSSRSAWRTASRPTSSI